jgi:hypothetical protein
MKSWSEVLLRNDRGWNRGWRLHVWTALLIGLQPIYAQTFGFGPQLDPSGVGHGFRIDSASVSSMYYSNLSGAGLGGPGLGGLLPNSTGGEGVLMQASALFEWSKQGPKGQFSATYSPGFSRSFVPSDFHSWNHAFSLTGQRTFGSKWAVNTYIRGLLTDFSQLAFSRVAGISPLTTASFEDLFNAMSSGRADPVLLASLASQISSPISPESAYAYGSRLLALSASATLSYTRSTRSSYSLTAALTRMQSIGTGASGIDTHALLLPNTTSGSLGLAWSYSLTPRTTFSANISETRVVSSVQDVNSTQSNVAFTRTLTPHWFVGASAGFGFTSEGRQTLTAGRNIQEQWGGSAGYRFRAQTVVGSFTRTVSDVYGVGADATLLGSGAWTWMRPGATYGVSGTFGYSRLLGQSYNYQGSWVANGSFTKFLGAHSEMSVGYSFVQFPSSLLLASVGSSAMQSSNGVVVTLTWVPERRQAGRETDLEAPSGSAQ